jgi:hypothetical protein
MPARRARPARILKAGEKIPPPDPALIPDLTSETIRIGFRADSATVDAINTHLDRLDRLASGWTVSVSDAVRSLIQRGAVAYLEDDERNQPDDEAQ